MKKFYALALAASVAASASAFNLNLENVQRQVRSLDLSKKEAPATPFSASMVSRDIPEVQTRLLSAKKADALTTLEGNWTFLMGDFYLQGGAGAPIEINYTCYVEDGGAYFEDPDGIELPFIAEYDEATGLLYFDKFYIGEISGSNDGVNYQTFFLHQEPFVYNYDTDDLDFQPIEGLFDAENAIITFEPDNGLAWSAFLDEYGAQKAGYFAIYDLMGAEPTAEDTSWSFYSDAILLDGWMVPGLTYQDGTPALPEDLPFEVKIERSAVNPDYYRIVDPYAELAEVIEGFGPGYIQFDLGNPKFVAVLPRIKCGATNAGMDLYCVNMLGLYMGVYPSIPKDEIIAQIGAKINEDGCESTLDDDTIYCQHVGFNFAGAIDKYYSWVDAADNMNSTVIFDKAPGDNSGITDVAVDNNKVVYYNLQGIQVENPSKGIFIRSNGKNTTKVYVR
ncbi:MAG: hypothetical protein J1E84_05940 [Muribaculaceae bacterium]|nr:hypothetical protein [Muribaculaceae bacterium]